MPQLQHKLGGMSDVTRILSQLDAGDPTAAEQLLPLVYHELRRVAAAKLAQEKPGHTLQATALVHEAYLRLVDPVDRKAWDHRGHFFAAAAEAMRRILVDGARKKAATKRGGDLGRVDLEPDLAVAPEVREDLVALDAALDRLAAEYPVQAELVKLRYFGGLSLPDAAAALGLAERTAGRHWAFARAWLRRAVEGSQES
ncbi:MAG TPA: sigma-70 family RNA polymerase sigma factor [Pirellulaceae bacterium]|nr:sigma-70 family RNA polymerase sigma factor [Pirellulaceae bacterium]